MESPVDDIAAALDKPAGYLRDTYPYFRRRRDGLGVFPGTVMDYSRTPASLRPENQFAAVSFEAVNQVFREADSFNSHSYDVTIGLFIGPTILAMEG